MGVKPEMIIRWHREGFRFYWRSKSRKKPGRRRPALGTTSTSTASWRFCSAGERAGREKSREARAIRVATSVPLTSPTDGIVNNQDIDAFVAALFGG